MLRQKAPNKRLPKQSIKHSFRVLSAIKKLAWNCIIMNVFPRQSSLPSLPSLMASLCKRRPSGLKRWFCFFLFYYILEQFNDYLICLWTNIIRWLNSQILFMNPYTKSISNEFTFYPSDLEEQNKMITVGWWHRRNSIRIWGIKYKIQYSPMYMSWV